MLPGSLQYIMLRIQYIDHAKVDGISNALHSVTVDVHFYYESRGCGSVKIPWQSFPSTSDGEEGKLRTEMPKSWISGSCPVVNENIHSTPLATALLLMGFPLGVVPHGGRLGASMRIWLSVEIDAVHFDLFRISQGRWWCHQG